MANTQIRPYYRNLKGKIYVGDAYKVLRRLDSESIDCCITSPPYYLIRDYKVNGQIGQEETHIDYVNNLTKVFTEVKRLLKPKGTLWLNIGDTYVYNRPDEKFNSIARRVSSKQSGIAKARLKKNFERDYLRKYNLKYKDLYGLPWEVAFSLRNTGWYLRQDIIYCKTTAQIEKRNIDRCSKSHEYIFFLTKSPRYYFNKKSAIGKSLVTGQNRLRSVWNILPNLNHKTNHYSQFPETLVERCIRAGCPEKGVVLDPFFGTGTTGSVAIKLNRKFIGVDISKKFVRDIAVKKIKSVMNKPSLTRRA